MPAWLVLILAVLAVTAVFFTTPAGERMRRSLGIPGIAKGSASREDRAFLLRICGGDRAEMERRLEAERRRFPALSDSDIHRRAIRTSMQSMTSSRSPASRP